MDLFADLENKKIILFGAGHCCDKYIEEYGELYPPQMIIDNDTKKWNKFKDGIKIKSPKVLLNMCQQSFRVIICSKHIFPMIKELDDMKIENYRIY